MEKKALIGVVPLVDIERESYWVLPAYLEVLRQQGALPIMLPLTEDSAELFQLADLCDGIVFTGGHDVEPSLYGEAPQVDNLGTCPARDRMELPLLKRMLELDKPVLGICRGLQFINAALGGTLYQDLPLQFGTKVEHHQDYPYDALTHPVYLTEDGSLKKLLGRDSFSVNSLHHQGIRRLAPGLKPMALAADGLVEAVEMPGKRFLWAVQWHPEFAYKSDEVSRKIVGAFVEACR